MFHSAVVKKMKRFERYNQKGRQTPRGAGGQDAVDTNVAMMVVASSSSCKEDDDKVVSKPVFQSVGEQQKIVKREGKKAKRFAAWLAKR